MRVKVGLPFNTEEGDDGGDGGTDVVPVPGDVPSSVSVVSERGK